MVTCPPRDRLARSRGMSAGQSRQRPLTPGWARGFVAICTKGCNRRLLGSCRAPGRRSTRVACPRLTARSRRSAVRTCRRPDAWPCLSAARDAWQQGPRPVRRPSFGMIALRVLTIAERRSLARGLRAGMNMFPVACLRCTATEKSSTFHWPGLVATACRSGRSAGPSPERTRRGPVRVVIAIRRWRRRTAAGPARGRTVLRAACPGPTGCAAC
jgi:hypothetical protein